MVKIIIAAACLALMTAPVLAEEQKAKGEPIRASQMSLGEAVVLMLLVGTLKEAAQQQARDAQAAAHTPRQPVRTRTAATPRVPERAESVRTSHEAAHQPVLAKSM